MPYLNIINIHAGGTHSLCWPCSILPSVIPSYTLFVVKERLEAKRDRTAALKAAEEVTINNQQERLFRAEDGAVNTNNQQSKRADVSPVSSEVVCSGGPRTQETALEQGAPLNNSQSTVLFLTIETHSLFGVSCKLAGKYRTRDSHSLGKFKSN